MKKFLLLHIGFEMPTPEIMERWGTWFKSISDRQIEQVGFKNGVEISKEGRTPLQWDSQSLTGFNIIYAESLEEAEEIAKTNPFITSIRVYELR